MIIARTAGDVRHDKNSVVTVGTFDGVHLAHQEIIREVVNRARMREGRGVVITFDPHPKQVVQSRRGPVQLLSSIEERCSRFERLQVDLLWIIPFTYQFSRLGSRDFYRRYVVETAGASEVVVGYDHTFGKDREAGTEDLVRLGKEFDFSVFAVHPYTLNGEPVSSTRIRRALMRGAVEEASMLLGSPYSLRGRVVRGDGRGGKIIGFPTANLAIEPAAKLIPAKGVYVVGARIDGNEAFGMMNIGVRPTVAAEPTLTVEVHLFDFRGELYGEMLEVSLLHRLRDEIKFGSVQELTKQLENDREQALRLIAGRVRQQ
jgi:riboflavin kinase/FMN adenylyltransferase